MIRWEKVPWTLWAYVILFGGTMIVIAITTPTPALAVLITVAVVVAYGYFLLKGTRWLWIATVVLFLGYPIEVIAGTLTVFGIINGVVSIALLLARPTWRFFVPPKRRAVTP